MGVVWLIWPWVVFGQGTAPGADTLFDVAQDSSVYQGNPAISGNWVVWEQCAGEGLGYQVYARNLAGGEIVLLSRPGEEGRWPVIDGDFIVWSRRPIEGGEYDIYIYDLGRRKRMVLYDGPGNQVNPAVHGDTVVWRVGKYPSWSEIWGYSLSERRAFRVCDKAGNKWKPAIYGNKVVWGDYRNGNWDIYGADISNRDQPVEFEVATGGAYQRSVAICGDVVAYEQGSGVGIVRLGDPNSAVRFKTGHVNDLDICDNVVVVAQWREPGLGYDIYGYRISFGRPLVVKRGVICQKSGEQYQVAIDGQRVVWGDDRAGGYYHRNIHGAGLSTMVTDINIPLEGRGAVGFWGGRDINGDGVVNMRDFARVSDAWGKKGGEADLNGDDVVDRDDVTEFARGFLDTGTSGH